MRYLAALPPRPGMGMWPTRAVSAGEPPPPAWTPDDLPGRIFDWDAERGPIVAAGLVVEEADQSGSNNDALSLVDGANQPVMSTAPGLLNRTSVYYGGTAYQYTALDVIPAAYTIYFVGQAADTAGRVFFATGTNGGGNRFGQSVGGSDIVDWIVGNAFSTDGPATSQGISVVFSSQAGPAPGAQLWIGGVEVTLSEPNTAALAVSGPFIFGAAVEGAASGLYLIGHRCRIIGCAGRPDLEDVARWSAWTLAEYGK